MPSHLAVYLVAMEAQSWTMITVTVILSLQGHATVHPPADLVLRAPVGTLSLRPSRTIQKILLDPLQPEEGVVVDRGVKLRNQLYRILQPLQHPESFNVHSVPRASKQSMIGKDTRNRCIYLSNGGSVLPMGQPF